MLNQKGIATGRRDLDLLRSGEEEKLGKWSTDSTSQGFLFKVVTTLFASLRVLPRAVCAKEMGFVSRHFCTTVVKQRSNINPGRSDGSPYLCQGNRWTPPARPQVYRSTSQIILLRFPNACTNLMNVMGFFWSYYLATVSVLVGV